MTAELLKWIHLFPFADLIHEETRLSVYLDSFEHHIYNRSNTYSRLEDLFGLDKTIAKPEQDKAENNET